MKSIFTLFTKRLLSIILVFVLFVSFLTSCNTDTSFASFTNTLFLDTIISNTITLHYSIENPSSYRIRKYPISLGDFSEEAREQTISSLTKTLNRLHTYPYLTLSTEEQLTYDVLEDYLNSQLALSEYSLYEEPFSASGGIHMELPILFAEYEFKHEQDIKDYLALLALTDEYFKQILDFEKEKASAGFFMSDSLCQKVIASCESFLNQRDSHYLSTTFENRLSTLNLSEKKRESYIQKNNSILQKQLFPAYECIITEFNNLLGSGKNNLGLCYLPNGSIYYEQLVYSYTGCDHTIDQLYKNIEIQRMRDLIVCANLKSQDENLVQQCASLEWEMENVEAVLYSLNQKIQKDFPSPPQAKCKINYVDPSMEAYLAPAFYIVAPMDNYLENSIYINNSIVTHDLYGFTTLAHEGFPGHLYQTVMSYEYDLPEIRTILDYPGFTEGWATYVEIMSYDYTDLDSDITSFLKHNQSSTLSLYASSDIGIHYYGWDYEDMYNFWGSYGITDSDTINEITQLILSEPGNYLKYYVGYLEFLSLQDFAKNTLSENFSLKEFHRTILDIGPAPFSIIKKYFLDYYSPQT